MDFIRNHGNVPKVRQVVDDQAVQFFPSPFAWVQNPYDKDFLKGYGSYHMWASTAEKGFARYQPDLKAGRYRISLHPDAHPTLPYSEETTKTNLISLKGH